jgi:hypothetical protein
MLWLSEKDGFDKLTADGEYRVGDEKDEAELDNAGNPRPLVVGHYTAIIWRTTTHIGAAKLEFRLTDAQGTARTYVAVVCHYDPPGNIRGEKPR